VAEDVAPVSTPTSLEAPVARRVPGRAERARASAYSARFGLAYVLLALVVAGGIAALVVVLTRPGGVRPPRWSAFVPTGTPDQQVLQIATQVSSEYRSASGGKLVAVLPDPLQATRYLQGSSGPVSVEVPISTLAVQPDISTGKHAAGDYTTYDAGSTVAYQMCGFGGSQQNCAIASGGSAKSRGPLLRREALELSLYTLKYVPGANAVLTYLPPPSGSASPTSLFVARKDVARNLDHPLTKTLTPEKLVLGRPTAGAARIDRLTLPDLYTYDYQTLPGDGTAILVLTAAISAAK